MITIALLTLTLAQTVPTKPEAAGAAKALAAALSDVTAGQRTPTRIAGSTSTACVGPRTSIPAGSVPVRYDLAILTPATQQALGLAQPAYGWRDEYAVIEAQAPTSTEEIPPTPGAITIGGADGIPLGSSKRASPAHPTCEVAIYRHGAPSVPWGCACSRGSGCTWIDPDRSRNPSSSRTAAPTQYTLPEGSSWQGACEPKPCVARFMGAADETWYAECGYQPAAKALEKAKAAP